MSLKYEPASEPLHIYVKGEGGHRLAHDFAGGVGLLRCERYHLRRHTPLRLIDFGQAHAV